MPWILYCLRNESMKGEDFVQEITIGMVGFGSIAKTHCIAAANIAMNTELPIKIGKVYRRNQERTLPFFTMGYADSMEALIEGSDVIDICSPNDAHFEQAKQVLKAGKALYLEKPVGINMEQADGLLQLVKERPADNQVALMYRFMPAVVAARDLVAAGDIGDIIDFRCQVQHSGYLDPGRKSNWKLKKKMSGGGPLLDIGIHIADMIRFTLGEVTDVECRMKTVIDKRRDQVTENWVDVDVEDWAWARLELDNDISGTMEITRVASVLDQSSVFSVYGTKGSLEFCASEPTRLKIYHQKDGVQSLGEVSPMSAFGRHLASIYPKMSLGWMADAHAASQFHFYKQLAGEKIKYSETPDIEEAVKSQRVIDACYRSAGAGGSRMKVIKEGEDKDGGQ